MEDQEINENLKKTMGQAQTLQNRALGAKIVSGCFWWFVLGIFGLCVVSNLIMSGVILWLQTT